jgi:hypothetical protein
LRLAALIAAYQSGEGGEGLRATLPIGGHALVEHQARQAAQAGAAHIVLLVERVPAALTAAIDRLRSNGLTVDVARSVAEAADRIHPQEALLVIADGLIADQAIVDRLVAAEAPAILSVPDDSEHQAFERIDAAARWGGLMLVDGGRLRRTAAMLGDWDLQSTLLRRTVQEGAARVPAARPGNPAGLVLVDRAEAVDVVRERLLAATRGRRGGWPARLVYAPIEDLASPALMRAGVDPWAVRAIAVALLILAAAGFAAGFGWLGLALLLAAGPVDAVAARLARLRLQRFGARQPASLAKVAGQLCVLGALGWFVAAADGWGAGVLAAGTALFTLALAGELKLRAARLGPAAPRPPWLADGEALALVLLPFALAGWWLAALAFQTGYAALSFFAVQRTNLQAARGAPEVGHG